MCKLHFQNLSDKKGAVPKVKLQERPLFYVLIIIYQDRVISLRLRSLLLMRRQ